VKAYVLESACVVVIWSTPDRCKGYGGGEFLLDSYDPFVSTALVLDIEHNEP